MGWSQPTIARKAESYRWSPWVCLLIILMGVFCALAWVVLHSPVGGMPALASGYWLPLTLTTIAGVAIASTAYFLCCEALALRVWNWNEWRRDTAARWQRQAHQHLFIAEHVTLMADPQRLPQLAGVVQEESEAAASLTLLPEEILTPGIQRFEQLCCLLTDKVKDSLFRRYPSGPLTVLIHTAADNSEDELQAFRRFWEREKLPWHADVAILPKALPFSDWNSRVSSSRVPVLILALHYRQSGESLPEFASAILLTTGSLLTPVDHQVGFRLFRAMPLNSSALAHELKALRDMRQQAENKRYLVWHCGLAEAAQRGLGRIVNALPLPLNEDFHAGGIINFDKQCGEYGGLSGWLMIASAMEMGSYGAECHWLLCENEAESWAVVLGNAAPSGRAELANSTPPPFPVGSIMLALLFNVALFGVMVSHFPALAFSISGMAILLLSLVVTLPGVPWLLRQLIAIVQRPQFIKAARQSGKE